MVQERITQFIDCTSPVSLLRIRIHSVSPDLERTVFSLKVVEDRPRPWGRQLRIRSDERCFDFIMFKRFQFYELNIKCTYACTCCGMRIFFLCNVAGRDNKQAEPNITSFFIKRKIKSILGQHTVFTRYKFLQQIG